MANARLDENSNPAITALLNTDGATITRVTASPTSHGLSVDNGVSGTDHGGNHALLDQNSRPSMFALSSAGDGTLVSLYADSTGKLLIQST